MGGPTSQNTPTRQAPPRGNRGRRIAVSVAGTIAFLAAAWMVIDTIDGSELARTIDAHLTQLADPRSWIP